MIEMKKHGRHNVNVPKKNIDEYLSLGYEPATEKEGKKLSDIMNMKKIKPEVKNEHHEDSIGKRKRKERQSDNLGEPGGGKY